MHVLRSLDAHPSVVGCVSFGHWMRILRSLDVFYVSGVQPLTLPDRLHMSYNKRVITEQVL